jgi:hypothetical protein
MMINMRTMTRRVANNYKHKPCKMKTTKIKITTNKRVPDNCNEEKGKGKRRST